jgi:two-component system phosphate regulon sensor histidine kinase PhoR
MGLSRIEANRFAVPREPVSLASLVREAAQAAAPLASNGHCRIELDLAEDLPSLAGDSAQLRQVVENLLNNALRYGCRSPGDAVSVQLRADGGWQSLVIRDSGEGIAAEHLPRLTERFYRVDAARSRDSGGTGLGLAIVKQIVERHRGLLEIRSQPGKGTEVEVRLPSR